MKRSRRRILVVRLGYSGMLDPESGRICDLAAVFRATVVLHIFRNDHVSWLTAPSAAPLITGNPHVQRLLVATPGTMEAVTTQRFDVVVNLDADPETALFAESIEARERLGHRPGRVGRRPDRLSTQNGCEWLYDLSGARWQGEEYVLGYQPRSKVEYDLGFNADDGSCQAGKTWPAEHWARLEQLVAGRHTFTTNRYLYDLAGYMDWVHSCRVLVSHDGLGLSLALAMKKRVVALFGPVSSRDVPLWGRGIALVPEKDHCALEHIRPPSVASAIATLLAEPAVA